MTNGHTAMHSAAVHMKSRIIISITRKRGNCECIAPWGRPTPRQSFSALIIYDAMPSFKSLNLSTAVL